MANIQKDILFDHFISGMEKEMQATLRMMYLNSCNIDEANRRREMEQMKEEIVQDVLSRISASAGGAFPPSRSNREGENGECRTQYQING